MAVEDYANKWKRKLEPEKVEQELPFMYFKIETLVNDKEKISLLKEMYPYFTEDMYHDALYYYDYGCQPGTLFQSYKDGQYGLYSINVGTLDEGYYVTKLIRRDKNEFLKEYSKYPKYGEQRYTTFNIRYEENIRNEIIRSYDYPVYYFMDGNIFVNKWTADYINKITVDNLGNYLGYQIYTWEKDERERREKEEKYYKEQREKAIREMIEESKREEELRNRPLIKKISDKLNDWFGY